MTTTAKTTMQSAERDEVGAPPACGGESSKLTAKKTKERVRD
jgi:hypothetical protein